MTDFIIVGQGLAANVLAHTFVASGLSFKIIGAPQLSKCSQVAAGIWNPVVFKRLTKSWMADATVPFLETFYSQCEHRLNVKFVTQRKLIRPFSEEQEARLWLKKSKNELDNYLDENIVSDTSEYPHCIMPLGYGLVKQAGNVDIPYFLENSRLFFNEQCLFQEFDHTLLEIFPDSVSYKNLEARNIIFCEGHLVQRNPYFSFIPLKPVKGEVLSIHCPDLNLKNGVLNKGGFIMDTGPQTFKVGATYQWEDLNETPTTAGLEELKGKVEQMLGCGYRITAHEAGIRPSSADRRPVIGAHPLHKNVFVFNGLGTKGVMLAPFFANNFVNFYQQKQTLNTEVDVKRFYRLFSAT